MPDDNPRHSDYPLDPIFLDRWSPRSFTSAPMSEADLLGILEAARWAPSSYNSQPWRFIYARRDTPAWTKLFGLLNASNQSWCKTASALIVVVSSETRMAPGSDKATPSYTHSFDAGAAWMSLALQARHAGWYAHGMIGFDTDRAFEDLDVPAGFRVEAAIAIGRKGDPSALPEGLRAREKPNDRKPLAEIAFEGSFRS